MIAVLLLAGAIVSEVAATLSLQASVRGSRLWYLPVVTGYVLAFSLLSGALAQGMPLGVAYGVWTACGVALTAVLGRLIFGHAFTGVMALGIALIIGGVLCIELGAVH